MSLFVRQWLLFFSCQFYRNQKESVLKQMPFKAIVTSFWQSLLPALLHMINCCLYQIFFLTHLAIYIGKPQKLEVVAL